LSRYAGRGQGEGSSANDELLALEEEPSPQPSPGVPAEGECAFVTTALCTSAGSLSSSPGPQSTSTCGNFRKILVPSRSAMQPITPITRFCSCCLRSRSSPRRLQTFCSACSRTEQGL